MTKTLRGGLIKETPLQFLRALAFLAFWMAAFAASGQQPTPASRESEVKAALAAAFFVKFAKVIALAGIAIAIAAGATKYFRRKKPPVEPRQA
ncbi:MAG: hypothetical protein ABI569_07265 [Casimicrobiaceae bacterium]